MLSSVAWKHKGTASGALYDLLLLHTTDDAQQLAELQDESGPEAWRQLSIRFGPIGAFQVFDQMSALMDVPRCKQLTELPGTLTR